VYLATQQPESQLKKQHNHIIREKGQQWTINIRNTSKENITTVKG
jgi:hypothetical protein